MTDANLPNLFVLGAPKCGTTALCNYLRSHPELYVPPKEMHFFGRDLTFHNKPRLSHEAFKALYDGADGQRYRTDCAIWYLFSLQAADEIADACPDARCIVLLRNPADMLYSLHSEFLYQGDEDISEFRRALDAEDDRRRGGRIPPGCDIPWALQYRQVARYAEQIARYFALFPKVQIHVVLYDDLVADTAAVYRNVLRFLEVDTTFQPDLDVVNPNKVVRSAGMRHFLRNPPAPLRHIGRTLVRNQRSRWIIGNRLLEMNTVKKPRQVLDPGTRLMLDHSYADDIDRLAAMIGRDLSGWGSSRPSING